MRTWCCCLWLCIGDDMGGGGGGGEGKSASAAAAAEEAAAARGWNSDGEEAGGSENGDGFAGLVASLGFPEGGDVEEQMTLFQEMEMAMGGGGEEEDSDVLGGGRGLGWGSGRAAGESSGSVSGAAAAEMAQERDHDWHHKRAKVHTDAREINSATASSANAGSSRIYSDRHFNLYRDSSASALKSELNYPTSMSDIIDYAYHIESRDGIDNVSDVDGEAKTEDSEVRMDLTDDLLHMVFSFLNHMDLCRAALVCRQWRAASAHEDFWKCLNFENRINISIEQFEDMCRRYPNAAEVNITGASAIHLLVMKAVSSLRNLEALTLGKGQLGDTFFYALSDCNLLKSLNVTDATLGNGIQEIHINHDRLRHLQLIKCRVMRIVVRCPQLEALSLKRSNMAQAQLSCPFLRDLDIGSCHKLSDAAIRSAAISCPLLESLDMSNCSCVSDETLREIALTCANLHVLNASYCPNISLESVRLPMLTVLKLDNCEGITSASMAAIAHSYMLEVLELDNCSLLTSVSLDLPRLQNIRLVHCRKFADLYLRTLMLSSIMVSNCGALHRINITSNSLQKLALQKQESLTTLALQCQSLQEVDLTACESLTDSICEVFNDGGGCPLLKSLVLDNCESLMTVRFCSTSLVSLSLSECRGITTLDLTCPNLQQVCLDGCDHLEKAHFCPVGLESLNLGICPKLRELTIEAPKMVLLELKGCGVLAEASINCPLLTSLDASFCSRLRDDCLSATATSCPLIESLILMSCPSVGSDGLYSLCWLPHLTMLDLSYTFLTNLVPVFKSCLHLKVLKLQACKYLTDSSLEPLYMRGALPSLRELDLSYGPFSQSAIEELLSCCTHLTHVSLNGCVNMHDLNWGCPGDLSQSPSASCVNDVPESNNLLEPAEMPNRLLQNLTCVGCPNIRKVFIPLLARCYNLSSLNLSLSNNLKEVDVACSNLCLLNLSNCCSLETLRLECPKLTSLFLQWCNITEEALEAAVSRCTTLETLDVRYCPQISSVSMGRLRVACPSLKRIFSSLSPP
ncbi:F-box/LRR-repeat protein 15 [Syzygium oleosum]|uniref:F-box/LRR-repeat protein 15 n=1 Tax=Syzygium oleosum TaxID=219896 RepID=UPI0011D281A7|nr:F-box/LRR-repeat protein 15 [Syzygium oleosum]